MASVPLHGDIQIDQDPRFQQRDWHLQRVGRIALVFIVAAALAGAWGDGPLSSSSVRTADGRLQVDYDRIARHAAPQPLRVHIDARAAADSVVELWIDQQYAQGVVMGEISPAPVETWAGGDRLMYRFRLVDLPRTATVVFQLEANQLWARHGGKTCAA